LGGRKGIRPVKTDYWYAVGADMTGALHVLEFLMSLPHPITSCCVKKSERFSLLVLVYPGCPGIPAVKGLHVDVVIVMLNFTCFQGRRSWGIDEVLTP